MPINSQVRFSLLLVPPILPSPSVISLSLPSYFLIPSFYLNPSFLPHLCPLYLLCPPNSLLSFDSPHLPSTFLPPTSLHLSNPPNSPLSSCPTPSLLSSHSYGPHLISHPIPASSALPSQLPLLIALISPRSGHPCDSSHPSSVWRERAETKPIYYSVSFSHISDGCQLLVSRLWNSFFRVVRYRSSRTIVHFFSGPLSVHPGSRLDRVKRLIVSCLINDEKKVSWHDEWSSWMIQSTLDRTESWHRWCQA